MSGVKTSQREEDLQGFLAPATSNLAVGVLSILGIIGAYKLSKDIFDSRKQADTFGEASTVGTPAYYAQRLGMAIRGFGVDADAVLQTAREVPSKSFWHDVERAYSNMYDGDILLKDLEEQYMFWDSDMEELKAIINSKP